MNVWGAVIASTSHLNDGNKKKIRYTCSERLNKNLLLKEFPRSNQKNNIYHFLEEYDERAKKVRTAASSYTIYF